MTGGKHPIRVRVIDPKTKLAIWENLWNEKYQLYVPAENATAYDLIVNVGGLDKPDEFDFDKIDFKGLLKNRH